MATNTNQAGDARRINVECSCGKRLSALPQHAGKRVKCPVCGQALVVPAIQPPPQMGAPPQVENESEGMSRNTLFALWSFGCVFALACVLILVWQSHSSHQAKVAAANQITALRREQLVEQAKAAAIFEDAKKRLDGKDVENAIELLSKYAAGPHSTEKADAQRLLTEAETAVSDSQTLDVLVAMTDEDFDRVKATGEIRDGKVTYPALTAARTETIQRNLKRAAERREEIRLAEEQRREKERLAREHSEWLRTRTPDVRNVCWGDSLKTVTQVEDIPLKQERDSLSGKVELYGREAILSYCFYDDKLVRVSYWISFGESGNPFELDVPLRSTLEDKYGEGKIDTFGKFIGGIDMSAASRETVWNLPRHTTELKASSFTGRHGRNLFLNYEAKTAEARAYNEQQKRELDESLRKSQEKLKKNL